ncbi:MAG: hypothetical protein R3362_00985 [Rhodothermales bacterium]|nr:hypothetical protein [Rhodothermales bacterium]
MLALLLASLLPAASVVGLVKAVLLAALAVLNGVLALLATISVWKTYMVVGMKVLLTLLVCIPILGVVIYFVWGQRKVRENR